MHRTAGPPRELMQSNHSSKKTAGVFLQSGSRPQHLSPRSLVSHLTVSAK